MQPIFIDFETFAIAPRWQSYPPKPVGVSIYDPETDERTYYTGKAMVKRLAEIWESGRRTCYHNSMFDLDVAETHLGLPWPKPEDYDDTLTMAFLTDCHVPMLSLKYLAEKWCGIEPGARDELHEWILANIPESNAKTAGAYIAYAPVDLVAKYAVDDVLMTKALRDYCLSAVEQQQEAYLREISLQKILIDNERKGVRVDRPAIQAAIPMLHQAIEDCDTWIRACLKDPDLVVSSGPSLAKALLASDKYDHTAAWPTTKKGKPSTAKDTVANMITDKALIDILRYRSYASTIVGTFAEPWLEQSEKTGRIYTQWNAVRGERGGTRCMPAGELVLTNKGYKPVEDVGIGDKVIAHTGKARTVVETVDNGVQPLVKVKLANGLQLITTHNHKFYVEGKWIQAAKLTKGEACSVLGAPEKFKPIPGWKDFSISSWGRVLNTKTGRFRKLADHGWRQTVNLYRNGAQTRSSSDRKDFKVHLLVARAFLPRPTKGQTEVRHLDGHYFNNHIENLKWGTSKENSADAMRHGTTCMKKQLGRLTAEVVTEIRKHPSGQQGEFSSNWWAAKLGVNARLIRSIRANTRWKEAPGTGHKAEFYKSAVASVELLPPQQTYGLMVEEDRSHVTGAIVTHNTGRLSAKPTLQTAPTRYPDFPHLPITLPDLPKVRAWLLPDEGDVLVSADFSGQELRLFAHFENGQLKDRYLEDPDADLHQFAAEICTVECGFPVSRRDAKTLAFTIVYGGGSQRVVDVIGCTLDQARSMINAYKRQVARGLVGMQKILDRRYETKTPIKTLGGRLVKGEPPGIYNGEYRKFSYKMLNLLIQSSAADQTKQAMVNYKGPGRILLSLHDQIVLTVPRDQVEQASKELVDTMINALPMRVPMRSDLMLGENFSECK